MGTQSTKIDVNLNSLGEKLTAKQLLMLVFAVKLVGVAFATLVFARFSPLIDSELYLKGFYYIDPHFRTLAIQWMASAPNRLGGAYVAHITFALISVVGLTYYFLTGGRRWILIVPLLLPSSLVWTSIVGKEAVFFGSMALSLVVWSKYTVKPLEWVDVAVATVAFGVCAELRPHYAISIGWLFVSTTLLKRRNHNAAGIILVLLFIVGVVATYLTVWQELLYRGYGAIEHTARASRHQALGILPGNSEGFMLGFEQFKSNIPLAIFFGIVGPFPSEALKRLELLPFFLEGVLILIFPLFVALWVKKHKLPKNREFFRIFWWCLMPAILILMVLHAPFGLLNPGSATRWRTNFEQIFYLAPLLLMFRFTDDAPTENHSFPP